MMMFIGKFIDNSIIATKVAHSLAFSNHKRYHNFDGILTSAIQHNTHICTLHVSNRQNTK